MTEQAVSKPFRSPKYYVRAHYRSTWVGYSLRFYEGESEDELVWFSTKGGGFFSHEELLEHLKEYPNESLIRFLFQHPTKESLRLYWGTHINKIYGHKSKSLIGKYAYRITKEARLAVPILPTE